MDNLRVTVRRTARLLSHIAPQACGSNDAEDEDLPDGMPDDYEAPAMKYRPRYWTAEEIEALRVRSPPDGEPEHLIVVSGKVYDVTEFLIDHPGGGDVITELEGEYASEEMTDAFEEAEHSDEAVDDLFNYYVGVLVDGDTGEPVVPGLQLEAGPLGPEPELDDFDGGAGASAGVGAGAGASVQGEGGLEGEDFDNEDDEDDEGATVSHSVARSAPRSATLSVSSEAPFAFPDGPMRHTVLTLSERKQLSADTLRLRFALPSPCQQLGLPTGKHLQFMAKIAGGADAEAGPQDTSQASSSTNTTVVRSYTPVSLASAVGHVELVIKVYHSLAAAPPPSRLGDPRFPLGGRMSQFLSALRPGDGVRVRGPRGRLSYGGEGQFRVRARKVPAPLVDGDGGASCASVAAGAGAGTGEQALHARRIGMIAGGTGIAPMLQLLRAELEAAGLPLDPPSDGHGYLRAAHATDNAADNTAVALESALSFSLLFANRRVDDVLCRRELEHAASALNGAAAEDDTVPSLRMCYTVDTLDGLSSTERHRWEHEQGNGVGYITKQMLARSMPPPGPDTLILLCGPKPMVKHACLPALAALGYDRARCFVY